MCTVGHELFPSVRVALGLLAAVACASCVTRLEIVADGLKMVPREEISEYIGRDEQLPLVSHWAEGDFIVFYFSATDDLLTLAASRKTTIVPAFWFCDRPEVPALLGIPSIYARNTEGHPMVIQIPVEDGISLTQPRYWVVLFLRWSKSREVPASMRRHEDENYVLYDLVANPEGICMRLAGGDMVESIASNEISIDADRIRSELAEMEVKRDHTSR